MATGPRTSRKDSSSLTLLIVAAFIFMTRWAVAVPMVMYEGASPRAALRRSQALVAGHGRAVLTVLLNAGFRVAIAGALSFAGASVGGLLAFWLGTTLAPRSRRRTWRTRCRSCTTG